MNKQLDKSTGQRFSSRLGLLLSALGVAVGTGNIWRFPRIAAQSGGDTGAGAFLIAWLCFLFLWSIPLIIAEYASGRKHRSGVVGVFIKSMGSRFTWIGSFVAFVPLAITFFYTVVVGWCIYYFVYMTFHPLPADFESAMLIWESYQSSAWPLFTHAAAILFGALAIWKGINSIEKVNKILIPSLFLVVIISVIRAVTLPGAGEGLAYLFTPDLKQLGEPKTWLDALTQNAWDTGAGWGLFLTFAAYMKKEHGTVKNAFLTGIGNNTVSLLAGIMVFGTVFAVLKHEMGMSDPQVLEIMKTSGPASTGLTFIWMPQLFDKMFGGGILSVLFFLGLTFAGFSSLIAQLELPSRVLVDTGMKRNRAIAVIVILVFLFGIPSARNLNFLSNH
jgi:NSS family neurotransmitter:Na+ symporter